MIAENKLASSFHFHHLDHTCMIRDARKQRSAEFELSQVYYVGLRFWTRDDEERYRHALILADDFKEFMGGVAQERSAIEFEMAALFCSDCEIVFVRNMVTLMPQLQSSSDYQDAVSKIHAKLSHADEQTYMVFGLIDNERTGFYLQNTIDLESAINLTQSTVLHRSRQSFTPLEACLSHAVTVECYRLFDIAARRIQMMIACVLHTASYTH